MGPRGWWTAVATLQLGVCVSRRAFLGWSVASGAALVSAPALGGRRAGTAVRAVPWAQPTLADAPRGRAVLENHVDSHGPRDRWLGLPALVCELEVAWTTAARMVLPAMPNIHTGARLAVNFEADKVRLDFGDAAQTCWGFDSREAWSSQGDQRTYEQLHQVERIVRILAWYASMPHKLLDPGVLHAVVDGTSVGGCRGLWNERRADRRPDARVLRIWSTGRLRHTARGLGPRCERRAFRAVAGRARSTGPEEVRISLEAPVTVADGQVVTYRTAALHRACGLLESRTVASSSPVGLRWLISAAATATPGTARVCPTIARLARGIPLGRRVGVPGRLRRDELRHRREFASRLEPEPEPCCRCVTLWEVRYAASFGADRSHATGTASTRWRFAVAF